ncbi:hypothetical protein C9374_008257 [Naegleria lovaniensis]|uniref:START domain-containing protein n=1 Tax=Naegleria lovaniensis TaxID=51637 RepID=A0AA88GHF8_NAELO|nr:uncharacterized protein C9374_008257 [Naegleria lovaniensis]KAG2378618.1 hypothetical protein C9374_008257 [Naegleria lovaniensis]
MTKSKPSPTTDDENNNVASGSYLNIPNQITSVTTSTTDDEIKYLREGITDHRHQDRNGSSNEIITPKANHQSNENINQNNFLTKEEEEYNSRQPLVFEKHNSTDNNQQHDETNIGSTDHLNISPFINRNLNTSFNTSMEATHPTSTDINNSSSNSPLELSHDDKHHHHSATIRGPKDLIYSTDDPHHESELNLPKNTIDEVSQENINNDDFSKVQKSIDDERHTLKQLSSLEQEQAESLKLLRRKHRENYIPDAFILFCKHETSKVYGWQLESEKQSAQLYSKSISLHSIETGDFSSLSRLASQLFESTSTQDLSKNLKFKVTPHDSSTHVMSNRFVGILTNTNYRDVFEACRAVELRKRTKQMEEALKLEDFYSSDKNSNVMPNAPSLIQKQMAKIPNESFDVVYMRTLSPSTLIVSKREYLTARFFMEEPDRLIIMERSIDRLIPPPPILFQLSTRHEEVLNVIEQHENQLIELSKNISSNLYLIPKDSSSNSDSHLTKNYEESNIITTRQRSKSVGTTVSQSAIAHTNNSLGTLSPISKRACSTVSNCKSAKHLTLTSISTDNSLYHNLLQPQPTQKGVIRAHVLFQIMVFERLSDNETRFQVMNHIDVKGWKSTWSILSQKPSPLKMQEELLQLAEEYKKVYKNNTTSASDEQIDIS